MRRLGDPEDLFLHLRESLVADLHGEIAARDHQPDGRAAHRFEQQARQVLEGDAVLDLEHDAEVAGAERFERVAQHPHVVFPAHERQADRVGVAGGKGEVREILRGQRRDVDHAVRQVDPLVGRQALAAVARARDLDEHLARTRMPDHAADPAVVQPDTFAGPQVQEGFGQRAANADGRTVDILRIIGGCRGCIADEQHVVTAIQHDAGRRRGDVVQRGRARLALAPRRHGEHRVRTHVGRAVRIAQDAPALDADHGQFPFLPADVEECDDVVRTQLRQPAAIHADRTFVRRHRIGQAARRMQPDPGGRRDATERVALRVPSQHAGVRFAQIGAQLGSAEIHEDAAGSARFGCGRADVACDGLPRGCVVVGAVDPGALHAGTNHRLDHRVVGRSLGGHRHHDPDGTRCRGCAEQSVRVAFEMPSRAVVAGGLVVRHHLPRAIAEPVQQSEHLVEAGHHVGFGAAERRHAQPGQAILEIADVALAQGDVVDEVRAACRMGRIEAGELRGALRGGVDQALPHVEQFVDQGAERFSFPGCRDVDGHGGCVCCFPAGCHHATPFGIRTTIDCT